MTKIKTENSSVDIFIVEDLSDDQKTVIKSLLKIPYQDFKSGKALRVYDTDGSQLFYSSTRMKTLVQNDGYEVDVTNNEKLLLGKRFELTEVVTKKTLLEGKIAILKADAKVVNISKTGTDNAK
jgi:uncharacterized protein YxjI